MRKTWKDAYRNARLGNVCACAFGYPRAWWGLLYDAHGDRVTCDTDRHRLNRLRSYDPLWGALMVCFGHVVRDMQTGDALRRNRWRGYR